jgi:hypothetical protein
VDALCFKKKLRSAERSNAIRPANRERLKAERLARESAETPVAADNARRKKKFK